MDTQTFLNHFRTIADAPNGIDQLRDLILELTISGRLAKPGSDSDTPDSAVAKLLSTKDELLSIRSKPAIPRRPSPTEFPYRLPSSWELIRVDDSGTYTNGVAFKASERDASGIPIVRIQNLTNPQADFNFTNQNMKKSNLVEKGEILVSWSATLDAFIWQGPKAAVNQHIFKVDPETAIFGTTFLYLCLRWVIRRLAESEALHGLAMKHINRGDFVSAVIPVPPKEEQASLVGRFNHLISLCDQLETAKKEKDALRTAARESAINAVLTASTPEELSAAWARIRDNWTTYANTPESIATLRSLILDLALTGQLIPQDPADSLVQVEWSDSSLKLDPNKLWGREHLSRTPSSWQVIPMARLGKWGSGGTPTRSNKAYYGGTIPWLVIGDLNEGVVTGAETAITSKGLDESSATMIPTGAVLIAMYGSIGKSAIAGIECTTNQAIAHCVPDEEIISTDFLFRLVQAIRIRLLEQGRGMAQQNISQTILKHLLIGLPSRAEQDRIVARIDELLALCDELELAMADRYALREKLASSVARAVVDAT